MTHFKYKRGLKKIKECLLLNIFSNNHQGRQRVNKNVMQLPALYIQQAASAKVFSCSTIQKILDEIQLRQRWVWHQL